MKKTACLLWLVAYLLIAAAVFAVVDHRVGDRQSAVAAGIFGGGVTWMGIAYIIGIREKQREARMIRRAASGERPADGEKIAAIGTIMAASGEDLESPFSKSRCLAYEYKIVDRRGKGEAVRYSGFALAPSLVQSSRGSIRILAFTDLDFPLETVATEEAYRNAEEYLASLPPESTRPGGIGAAIATMKELMADDDGKIRSDIGDSPSTFDVRQLVLLERVLRPGEKICAVGTYSAQRGGLVPEPGSIVHPVKITKGDTDAALRKITRSYVTNFTCGMICLVAASVALAAFLLMVPLDAAEQIDPDRPLLWPEVKLERILDERLRPRLERAGVLSDSGFVTTNLSEGTAKGILEIGEERVALTRSAARRDGRSVTLRLTDDAGARGLEFDVASDAVAEVRLIGVPPRRGLAPGARVQAFSLTEIAEGRFTLLDDEVRARAAFRCIIQ